METFLGLTCLGWYLIGLTSLIIFNEIIQEPKTAMGENVFFSLMPRVIRIPYSLSIINFAFPVLAAFFVEKWYFPLAVFVVGWLLVPILSKGVKLLIKGRARLVMVLMPTTIYISLMATITSFIVLFK